jgi:hypothetical protein
LKQIQNEESWTIFNNKGKKKGKAIFVTGHEGP